MSHDLQSMSYCLTATSQVKGSRITSLFELHKEVSPLSLPQVKQVDKIVVAIFYPLQNKLGTLGTFKKKIFFRY